MRHKPTIYCSRTIEASVLDKSAGLLFWEVQSLNPEAADVVIHYSEDCVTIEGISQLFKLKPSLKQIVSNISPLDLSYIEQLFDDKEEQQEILNLAKKELIENLDELIEAMSQRNGNQIKYFAHKLTSKLMVLSIPAIESCHFIVDHANDVNNQEVQKNFYLLKMYCLICLWHIEERQ